MLRWIAIMAAVALAAGAAFGQSSTPPTAQPSMPLDSSQTMGHHMMDGEAMGPWMMDPSMMPMMPGMMGAMGSSPDAPMMCSARPGMAMLGAPGSYLEGRLAFVKAELAIDQAQQADWQRYADATRSHVQPMFQRMAGMHGAAMAGSDFPSHFDMHIQALEQQLAGLQAIRGAAVALYGHLTQDQKRKADALLPMSLCL